MAKVYRPRVPVELAHRIDLVRDGVPFEVWVRRALERALMESSHVAGPLSAPQVEPVVSSPPRSPAEAGGSSALIASRPVKSFRGRPVGPIPKKSQKKPE